MTHNVQGFKGGVCPETTCQRLPKRATVDLNEYVRRGKYEALLRRADALREALDVAELWLMNSMPIGSFVNKEPKPLPIMRAAITAYDNAKGGE